MLHTLARNWWALALRGLAAVLFGLLTFLVPGITLVTLVLLFGVYALVDGVRYVIAFWAIFTGVFEIIAGIRLRKVITNEWLLLVLGVLSLVFGILILFAPGA